MLRFCTLLLALAAWQPDAVQAQEADVGGVWSPGPLRIQATVQSWGQDCGPKPRSRTLQRSGLVRVTKSGAHLTIQGEQRQRSDRCWSPNPTLKRTSINATARRWSVTCATPKHESKRERGTYTLRWTEDDTLRLNDRSQYDWQLNQSRCQATITTTQTLRRNKAQATSDAPATATSAPARGRCAPEAPARVRIQPASAQIQAGARSCFRATLLDRAGCPHRRVRWRWRLHSTQPLRQVTLRGACVQVAAGAPDQHVELVASAAGREGRIPLVLGTPDLGDLIAAHYSAGGAIGTSAEELGVVLRGQGTQGSVASRGSEATIPLIWLAVAGILVLCAAFIAFALARGAGKRQAVPEAAASPTSEAKVMRCPKCGDRYPAHVSFCGKDGAALIQEEE